MFVTDAHLKRIMPHTGTRARRDALPLINKTAFDYDITTERRVAAWIATLAVESGELRYQEEIASGAAYEWRDDLGNTQKGDGRRFKGRGRIQITGRSNYAAYTAYLKKKKHLPFVDFIAEPHKLALEPYATDSAAWFFAVKIKANPLADAGQFLKIQVKVNGRNRKTGLPNHWPVRENYWLLGLSVLPDNFQLTAGEAGVNSTVEQTRPTVVLPDPLPESPDSPQSTAQPSNESAEQAAGEETSILDKAEGVYETASGKFDKVSDVVSGIGQRKDAAKSLWTTVGSTIWQSIWAVIAFIIGLPREIWLTVAIIAGAFMLYYLYRQVCLGKIREKAAVTPQV